MQLIQLYDADSSKRCSNHHATIRFIIRFIIRFNGLAPVRRQNPVYYAVIH